MEIKTAGNQEVVISGIVKTIDDSTSLRNTIQNMYEGGASAITLRFEDSFALPSAVIGYLMKLVNRDHVKLTLFAGDQRLVELLEELQLTATFGVRSFQR